MTEKSFDVRLYDVRVSSKLQLSCQIPNSILGTYLWPVSVAYVKKILFKDGFQNLGYSELKNLVICSRNSKRP